MQSEFQTRLTIVLPTFNERANIEPIATRLMQLSSLYQLEILFVDDDSADGTADEILRLSHRFACIRLIRRVGRFGLSSAIKEGILDATGDIVIVMDSDGQHHPDAVSQTAAALLASDLDLLIGSRFHDDATIRGLSAKRQRNSTWANAVARFSLPRYRQLTDYMSGFFALRPAGALRFVKQVDVSGFKFLYELLALSRGQLRVGEIPLQFQPRISGESKLNHAVVWDLGVSILHTLLFRSVPRRAISFGLVGASGIVTHLLLFSAAHKLVSLNFEQSQIIAVVGAASTNFLVNNILTFRAQQLNGLALVVGLMRFLLVTSLGMVANVGVSSAFYHQVSSQALLAMFAGIAVDFVWKYAASSRFVWNTP